VLVRQLRVVVDEERGREQVLRDPVGVLLAQGLELAPRDLVEIARLHALGDLRVVVPRADRADAERVAVDPLLAGGLTEAGTRVARAVPEAGTVAVRSAVVTGTIVTARTVPGGPVGAGAIPEGPVAAGTFASGAPVVARTVGAVGPVPGRTIARRTV
jgi:hypothetical protein